MWKPTNQPEPTRPQSDREVFRSPEPPFRPLGQPTVQSAQAAAPSAEKSRDNPAAAEPKRVNVIFSAPQYELLKRLAGRQGISVSDVLRQALSLTKLIVEADENPDERILIERKGQMQELRLVR